MAITVTLNAAIAPFGGHAGVIQCEVVATAENYVNGTGYTVDIPNLPAAIQWEDVLESSSAIATFGAVAYPAKITNTRGRINIKFYDGAVERATGAITGNVRISFNVIKRPHPVI